MIVNLAAILRESKRCEDFLARWFMGDEFLLVLPGTALSDARRVAERMRKKVRTISRKWEIPITISIGIACYPENGESLSQLLISAQQACFAAKEWGRNCTVSADELSER